MGIISRPRRDTIAFMPDSADRFKFADDDPTTFPEPDDPTYHQPSPSSTLDSGSAIVMMSSEGWRTKHTS